MFQIFVTSQTKLKYESIFSLLFPLLFCLPKRWNPQDDIFFLFIHSSSGFLVGFSYLKILANCKRLLFEDGL